MGKVSERDTLQSVCHKHELLSGQRMCIAWMYIENILLPGRDLTRVVIKR